MATAREAYARGQGEFVRALKSEMRRFVGSLNAETRDKVDASAVVHGVTEKQRGGFYAAVAYGLWEEWAPNDAPLLCPAGLIAGYRAEEEIHEEEFRTQVSGPHSQACAQVVTLSRVFARRLPLLVPIGDPEQPRRVQAAVADAARETPEHAVWYGVATGLALRFLDHATQRGLDRERWFRSISASEALAEWTTAGPFWVDIVKVGNVDEPVRELAPVKEAAYALRHGQERDYEFTIFSGYDDHAVVAWSARVRTKRLSGKQEIAQVDAPPTAHLWALSQLGFTGVVVGDYEFEINYMIEPETLEAIRDELIGAAKGMVTPRHAD